MFREKLLTLQKEYDSKILLELWRSVRSDTIAKLQSIATQLQAVSQDVRKARISGDCMSAVGGVVTTVGMILTPFTFGVSLGLAIPGAAISLAGVGTTIGATMAIK